MNWTPESLARAFHESYARVSPKFFGSQGNAPSWDEIPEKSKAHMIAVCADVLGEAVEFTVEEVSEQVPTHAEFEKAKEVAQDIEGEDALSDWEADLRRQIDKACERAPYARKGFDGIVR
jgi:hypothetical protein